MHKSYAKITWTLDVLGKFPKNHINYGYTEVLITSFLIDLYDEIEIKIGKKKKKTPQIIINCDNPKIPQTKNKMAEKNICFRAVQAMREIIPNFPPIDIEINIFKNIPLSGGLGGSSTNGVTVINGLNKLLKLNLSKEKIIAISAMLGSDTIFFASQAKAAIMRGRGEIIEEINPFDPKIWLVLVNPGIEILASEAYKALAKIDYKNRAKTINNQTRAEILKKKLEKKSSREELAGLTHNDLEKSSATFAKYPILNQVKKDLKHAGCLNAIMSGSGSTVFGVCASKKQAKIIKEKIQKIYSAFRVIAASTLF